MIDMTNTQTLTLADFLLARIAEDEAEADRWHDIECDVHSLGDAPLVMGPQPCDCKGPARVLAECEAKRQIVKAYQDEAARRDIYQAADARAIEDDTQARRRRAAAARCRGLEIAVQWLALPYADHPDYRDEWRA